jgi:hypothetical protein
MRLRSTTAQSPESGVKLTFRLNVVALARLAKKRYAFAQGCREKTSNPTPKQFAMMALTLR